MAADSRALAPNRGLQKNLSRAAVDLWAIKEPAGNSNVSLFVARPADARQHALHAREDPFGRDRVRLQVVGKRGEPLFARQQRPILLKAARLANVLPRRQQLD